MHLSLIALALARTPKPQCHKAWLRWAPKEWVTFVQMLHTQVLAPGVWNAWTCLSLFSGVMYILRHVGHWCCFLAIHVPLTLCLRKRLGPSNCFLHCPHCHNLLSPVFFPDNFLVDPFPVSDIFIVVVTPPPTVRALVLVNFLMDGFYVLGKS